MSVRRLPIADRDIVRISQGWDPPAHYGIDYSCYVGTPVTAPCDGIAYPREQAGGFGRYVVIESGAYRVYTAHLSACSVREGERVTAGQRIGLSGSTGNSTGPHLHFEVRAVGGSPYLHGAVDPDVWLAEGTKEQEGYMLTTLHCQRVPGWVNGVLRDWRSGWVKVVNPAPGLSFPDVPRLCARWWTDDRDAEYLREGREGGARFVRDMLPTWRGVQATCYETANEPDCNSNDGLAALNTYTIGAIEEAERQGIRLCVLNLAEGNPHDNGGGGREVEQWKWAQLAPAVQRAVQGGHYVGLHAYWRPGVEGPTGRYHALGRRQYDIEVLRGLGVDVSRLMVLVNECGIDGGIAGGPAQKGWRDLSTADAYRAELVEMERYARTIPQIQACMVFTAGFEEPWGGFDVDEGFARSLTAPLRALGSTLPITPIEEEEPVQAYELDAARDRMNRLPATMKACDARGYVFRDEWYSGGHFYCLAWNPFTSRYHTLKLETRGWSVVEDAAL